MSENIFAWHVHHMKLYEVTDGEKGIAERQRYIKAQKPLREQARRLRLLKLVKNQALLNTAYTLCLIAYGLPAPLRSAVRRSANKVINALHNIECPRCPWNGGTIFPMKKKAK